MQSVDQLLAKAKTFYDNAHNTIVNAKEKICENCEKAQKKIGDLIGAADEKTDPSDLEKAIQDVIDKAVEANSAVVKAAADAVKNGEVYVPPEIATPGPKGIQTFGAGLQEKGASNVTNNGDAGVGLTPSEIDPTKLAHASNTGSTGDAGVGLTPSEPDATTLAHASNTGTNGDAGVGLVPTQPGTAAQHPASNAATGTDTQAGLQPTGVVTPPQSPSVPAPSVGTPATPGGGGPGPSSIGGGSPSSPGSVGGQPSNPGSQMQSPDGKGDGKAGDAKLDKAEAGVGNTGAGTPDTLAQATPQTAQVAQPSISPASASPLQPLTPSVPPIDPSTAATAATQPPGPAAGAGPSPGAGPGVSGIPTGGGGSVAPPSGGGMPSMPPMPLGAPATPSPAGPLPPGPPPGPGVNPASTLKPDILAAPIPVSAARAERDAILAASTAGALAAGAGTNAALVLARRIGAALNVGATDFGFFWVTGLTTDGTIVVANSYGLGYIPDGVNLPDNVKMATADESIPLADRAKWVTYPILAVQGWAQAHNQKLRAVIATDAQFANFDPGAAKIVLQAEDIPDSGAMQGRNRLAVIAPGAAAQLASIGPAALNDVLPAPPADTNPPEDRSAEMWFDVAVPLMSTATDRGIAHMQQFVQYAEHAQELALYQAHTAADGVLQRAAIADWVYWQHLGVLMSDAIGTTANV